MKNLATLTIEETRMAMFDCTVDQLKRLCVGCREFISKKNIPTYQLSDMVRKESIIQKELMRRGVLNKANRAEFDRWINEARIKRIY